MSAAKPSKRFSTVGFTAPTAEEGAPGSHEVTTPVRHAVQTSSKGDRIAFTWRLTPEQADQLDTLVLNLRRQLGRGRLDRAAMLQAMVELVSEREDIQTDLVKRLDV